MRARRERALVGEAALERAVSRRVGLVLLLLGFVAAAALLAADVLGYRSALQRGDREFARSPSSASWQPRTLLPLDPAGRILDVGADLAFRRAAQSFEAVTATGLGFDSGVSEAATRGEVEADLAAISRTGPGARRSAADNMLGILAFTDSRQAGPSVPAPVDRSVGDFQAAVRADPSNETAKYNLERLLRALVAKGARRGSNGTAGGPSVGHRGAGGGLAGRGY
jgi:hypothetical protein